MTVVIEVQEVVTQACFRHSGTRNVFVWRPLEVVLTPLLLPTHTSEVALAGGRRWLQLLLASCCCCHRR